MFLLDKIKPNYIIYVMTKKEEREIKREYLNYEKPGTIAKRLNLKNFEVTNYIKAHEKEWLMSRPTHVTQKIKRCSICQGIVSNAMPEPGIKYNIQVTQHYYPLDDFNICYGCILQAFRSNYHKQKRGEVEKTVKELVGTIRKQEPLLDFNKYKK